MTANPLARDASWSQFGYVCEPGSGLGSTCGVSSTRSRPREWRLRGHCIDVSPKLDRREVHKKVQCTRAIKAAEVLSPGAKPKIDFEYGKVCCKVASGKQIFVAEITHDCGKFAWRIGDIRTALGVGSTMSTRLREKCVFSRPGITFATWNTCGSADIDIALLLETMSQVSSWSFVAIQEYGSAQRDGAELRIHRLFYQPGAWSRRAPAIVLHGDEAKTFVGVEKKQLRCCG